MYLTFRVLPLLAASLLSGLASLPLRAHAWGAEGHRLIAEVAERGLSAPARREAQRLLDLEPGATIVSVATWADDARTPVTASWHYVNFPLDGGCNYEPDRSCPGGACVVGAIERQLAVLASPTPDEMRLNALKYLIHLVADIHQPLHGGRADDKGGNTYQLQVAGRGTNLHALWDSGLIKQWGGGAAALREAVEQQRIPAGDPSTPARWAEESCRIVETEGFYPMGHKISDAYAERWNPVLVQRMAAASRRLSALLNKVLVPLQN
jgi:hypothetical protein